MRSGALQFTPPSVLRANMTSHRFELPRVEQSAYTFPRVELVERSTATQAWPSNPPGFGPPPSKSPARSTGTVRSKVGVVARLLALIERLNQNCDPSKAKT